MGLCYALGTMLVAFINEHICNRHSALAGRYSHVIGTGEEEAQGMTLVQAEQSCQGTEEAPSRVQARPRARSPVVTVIIKPACCLD